MYRDSSGNPGTDVIQSERTNNDEKFILEDGRERGASCLLLGAVSDVDQ